MLKCTSFCQTHNYADDVAVQHLLENITMQRCYDPFSLLDVIDRIPSAPVDEQPDIVIIMDWVKITVPFMTNHDVLQHKLLFGFDTSMTSTREGKHG